MCYKTIKGKLLIKANLKLVTGLHIGSSDNFSHIGAVNSIVIRDPISKEPIIPGSSLKGKLRFLLAKSLRDYRNVPKVDDEPIELVQLFGGKYKDKDDIEKVDGKDKPKEKIIYGRLQFWDLFMTNVEYIKNMDTDLHLTEVKFENTISRIEATANPRQIERVPKEAEFGFKVTYTIEDESEDIIKSDIELLADGIKLLHLDYIGGNGTRGYGRIKIENFEVEKKFFVTGYEPSKVDKILEIVNEELANEKF